MLDIIKVNDMLRYLELKDSAEYLEINRKKYMSILVISQKYIDN